MKNKISTTHKNLENIHHKTRESDQRNHCTEYQLKDDNEYKKNIIIENMRKSQAEKSVLMISARNIIKKKKKHDENFKNQNITLKKKNITDTSIYKIQKK